MSNTSTVPFFGRSWSLKVLTPAAAGAAQQTLLTIESLGWKPEPLRITFDVEMFAKLALWEADIAICNLNTQTMGLITQGAEVSLSADYQADGAPAEIFRGVVFQPMFERMDVTDFKLTLRCFCGLEYLVNNIVNVTTSKGAVQRDTVQKMAAGCLTPIPFAHLDPQANFTTTAVPRAQTIFGTPQSLFSQIAAQNNMTAFISPEGINIGTLENPGAPPDIVYAPPSRRACSRSRTRRPLRGPSSARLSRHSTA